MFIRTNRTPIIRQPFNLGCASCIVLRYRAKSIWKHPIVFTLLLFLFERICYLTACITYSKSTIFTFYSRSTMTSDTVKHTQKTHSPSCVYKLYSLNWNLMKRLPSSANHQHPCTILHRFYTRKRARRERERGGERWHTALRMKASHWISPIIIIMMWFKGSA